MSTTEEGLALGEALGEQRKSDTKERHGQSANPTLSGHMAQRLTDRTGGLDNRLITMGVKLH